jgi:hypothetical protein
MNCLSGFSLKQSKAKQSKALPFSETYMDKMLGVYNEM